MDNNVQKLQPKELVQKHMDGTVLQKVFNR